MTTNKNAVALRAFSHAGDTFAKDQVILGIDPGHLADWSIDGVGLVREVTADEVARAKGDKPTKATKPAAKKPTAKKAATASAPAEAPAAAPVEPTADA